MRTILAAGLMTAFLLTGCGDSTSSTTAKSSDSSSGTKTTATDGASSSDAEISLDPADLEKLDSWDLTSKASAKLTTMLADIMSEIKDEDSAKAALPKLKDLAPKFAAVNKAEKAFGDPSKEDQSVVFKNLAEANKKFDQYYTPISENESLKEIVGAAIDDAYVGNVTE